MTSNVSVSRITLYALDPHKTAEFYNALGLNLQAVCGWRGYEHHLDILESDGQKVFFMICLKNSASEVSDGLGFSVENVAETLQKLINLGAQVIRPRNPRLFGYVTVAEVIDPDGRKVGVYQYNR